jgi:hypothetical protein
MKTPDMINYLRGYFLIFLIPLILLQSARGQGQERGIQTTANASQVYFELGGPGVIYSFNYDGRFGGYENGIGFRIGMGGASWNGSGYIAIPMQLNYLLGTKGKYIELGGGATYAPNLDLFENGTDIWYGTLCLGFRKQPLGKKGFTFRAAFSPLIGFTHGGSFLPFAGVSWGYRF